MCPWKQRWLPSYFHRLSVRLLFVTLSLSLSSIENPASSLPPLFFFLLLIGAGLNKEKLKGKGKICFSVSALPSSYASTSWADRQAGRGRALWSDFPCSLFFCLWHTASQPLSHAVMLSCDSPVLCCDSEVNKSSKWFDQAFAHFWIFKRDYTHL